MNETNIHLILELFVVIIGVAVTRFLAEGTLVDSDPAFRDEENAKPKHDVWYWVCYGLALIILVTLIMRFMLGSNKQLMLMYAGKQDFDSYLKFFWDICFLMFFGAFLVAAARSETVRTFMRWLAVSSALGVAWSLIALWRGEGSLGCWWLDVNLIQCALTVPFYLWCRPLNARPGTGRLAGRTALVVVSGCFMIIFWLDIEMISLGKIYHWLF
ncbi:MAG TPA: hypothetical protein VKT53_02745 [Candidatus Acidoferrum sp.]|nr:hypothetical protein [Candidatus Acidoferrum sp.]